MAAEDPCDGIDEIDLRSLKDEFVLDSGPKEIFQKMYPSYSSPHRSSFHDQSDP